MSAIHCMQTDCDILFSSSNKSYDKKMTNYIPTATNSTKTAFKRDEEVKTKIGLGTEKKTLESGAAEKSNINISSDLESQYTPVHKLTPIKCVTDKNENPSCQVIFMKDSSPLEDQPSSKQHILIDSPRTALSRSTTGSSFSVESFLLEGTIEDSETSSGSDNSTITGNSESSKNDSTAENSSSENSLCRAMGPTTGISITFHGSEERVNKKREDRTVKVLGSTEYCSNYVRNTLCLKTVRKLNLDNCWSPHIIGLTNNFVNLKILSLINTSIITLQGFPKLPNLRKLDLSNNRISGGLNWLHGSPKLTHLNLSGNKIKNIETLKPLEEFKNFKNLDLYTCEVTNVDNYREKVFGLIKSLKYVDGYNREENEADDSEVDDDDSSKGDDENDDCEDMNEEEGEDEPDDDDVNIEEDDIDDEYRRQKFKSSGSNETNPDHSYNIKHYIHPSMLEDPWKDLIAQQKEKEENEK